MEIKLRLPFNGDFPVTFPFGAQPEDETIKQKFREWGIVGHHGIDFGLPEGSEVVAADEGVVKEAQELGDFGLTVIINHQWGESLYAHLQEIKVTKDQQVKAGEVIGLSGKTGAAFGPHLHFGIKPLNFDQNNGYLGFVDPAPYFASPREPEVMEKEEFRRKLEESRIKANEAKKQKKERNLNKIIKLAEEKGEITNRDIRELLHISQSTATNYLKELTNRGALKIHKKAKETTYSR